MSPTSLDQNATLSELTIRRSLGKVRIQLSVFLLLCCAVMTCAEAARLKPPLHELRNPIYSVIAIERIDAPMEDQRIRIRVLEDLRGPPTPLAETHLLILPQDDGQIRAGRRYLAVYTNIETLGEKPKKRSVRRPDRIQLAHINGADPAVFPDNEQIRTLLAPEHRTIEEGEDYRQTVINGLSSDDPGMVDLWSAELVIRHGTFPKLATSVAERLQAITTDPAFRPATRARLLMAALDRAPAYGADWFVASAHDILSNTRVVQVANNADLGQLIDAAVLVIQRHPDPSYAAALQLWLRSTPPIAEAAAFALREVDPGAEREAIERAIADPATPETTKGMLEDYLRRLSLLEERQQAVQHP